MKKRTSTSARAAAASRRQPRQAPKPVGAVAPESVADAALEQARVAHAEFSVAYGAIVRAAKLGAIRLVQSSFEVRPEFFVPGDRAPASRHTLAFGGELVAELAQKELGAVVGVYNWSVSARSKRGDSPLLEFGCTYVVEYVGLDLAEPMAEEAAKSFVRRVGKYAVFPYVRALMSQLSAAAGAEMPPLPVLTEATPVKVPETQPLKSATRAIEGTQKKKASRGAPDS